MLGQAITSILVGGGLSLLMSVPLIMHQYRRFGRFSAGRAAWTVLTVIYLTALIAYTLFPLPDMTDEFCARRSREFLLNPTSYFTDMARHLAGMSLTEALASWDVRQMVLNVALFVPLGVICREFMGWGPLRSLVTGFGVSLFIELTQYTGNWGLAPCPYRVADINDLMTNTAGTLVGIGVAALTPRLVAGADHLAAHRGEARPVTRARRWLGMALDGVYWSWAQLLGMSIGVVAWTGLHGLPVNARLDYGDEILRWGLAGAVTAQLAAIVVPALVGSGASLGQRTVYLRPAPASRGRLVARAMVVGGAQCLTSTPLPVMASLWAIVAVLSVWFDTRGISGLITGCRIVDARARAGAPARPEEGAGPGPERALDAAGSAS
ncbi:VanZ family protein [Propionibacterium australiense]|uniref:VanZ family protein n=1 Tax=Propionibacterium australiense TaxID=119981 RepID=A0A383S4V2_9ACTN|nr:VanZ family protein [Propionibacterium australiense]RLP10101.1 VanZ family protein [Propionibacterium australiense]RLP11385.1 VanZ family protein [Propionibacterium australiense]SYZ33030.1 VanZ-like [Propionibacterium australiense]VEH92209.1 VanZ like family [Propionibacterium australiense]